MKNKFLNLLFLFCCLGLFIGSATAEEFGDDRYDFSVFDLEDGDAEEADKDYSSICSKYTDMTERINCCNQDETSKGRYECKKPLFKACMEKQSSKLRLECCSASFTGEELEDCKKAATTYCDTTDKVKLSKAASAIKVEYEPSVLKADGYDDPNSEFYAVLIYALDIKVYNVTEDVYVVVEPEGGQGYSIDYTNVGPEGYITLRDDKAGEIKKYTFTVYSNTGNCEDTALRTIKISTPKYNQLSDRAACREVPHYYKCQMFVNYDFEVGDYVKDIEDYKVKLAKQGIKDTENEKVANKGVVSKTIKKVSDNKWIVLTIVIIIGLAITFVLIRKRKDD